jgi:bifunctional UDP-N-acetylglucosamine pyrophosphorylase/glucosamine-1-phosphate N-acetyltransferase
MGTATASTPKSLLEVAGKPLIEHILGGLTRADLRRLIVITGHLGEHIESRLGNGARFGFDETVYVRQTQLDGTARALLLAEAAVGGESFLLSWGDILVAPSFYRGFVDRFEALPCAAQLAVNEVDDPWQGAAVYVDADWRVERMEEKPPRGTATTRWNNAGILVLSPAIFDYARRLERSERGEFELPQAIARMVADGLTVRAYPIRGFWSDVGTADDLKRACEFVASGEGGQG